MIITYTYQVPLHDADGDSKVDMLRSLVAKMLPKQPHLRGMQASHLDGILQFKLRIAHETRYRIVGVAQKLSANLIVRIGLDWREAKETDLVRETTMRGIYPRVKSPRPATKPDGSPWDDLVWWGDQLDGYATESD